VALRRFFDPETGGDLRLELTPDPTPGNPADFRLVRRFGYYDPGWDEPFIVPRDLERWRTDLVSVPTLFAWLVPKIGPHVPAAIVHDALVLSRGEPVAHDGPSVTREQADVILRDAMGYLGMPVVRRWLMWAAVSLATCWHRRPRAYWQPVVVLTVLVIVALGVAATLDLLDVGDVLPWMGERVWYRELAGGAVFAVLIPAVVSLFYGSLRRAFLLGGVALAFLVHVTVAVAAVYAMYLALEAVVTWLAERRGSSVKANLRSDLAKGEL
jgi:hypothetical protein